MSSGTVTFPRFMGRVVLGLGLLFLATTAVVADAPAAANTSPIIVVGDVHGDYDAYMGVLQDAGLINQKGRWIGGNARFVQVGDIPDRGPDTDKILKHLMKLERQAAKKGGEVIALIGNHEAMNMNDDLRNVSAGEYAALTNANSRRLRDAYFEANRDAFSEIFRRDNPDLSDKDVRAAFDEKYPLGYVEHRIAWAPDGKFGKWVIGHDALRVIDGTLFLHGGISHDYLSMTIDEINDQIRAALRGEISDDILATETSPLWYRGNTVESEEGRLEVEAALQAFGVKRIVIGHTPNITGIRSLYDGKVIIVDTGMSAYYGGTRSYLRIDGDLITATNNGEPSGL